MEPLPCSRDSFRVMRSLVICVLKWDESRNRYSRELLPFLCAPIFADHSLNRLYSFPSCTTAAWSGPLYSFPSAEIASKPRRHRCTSSEIDVIRKIWKLNNPSVILRISTVYWLFDTNGYSYHTSTERAKKRFCPRDSIYNGHGFNDRRNRTELIYRSTMIYHCV